MGFDTSCDSCLGLGYACSEHNPNRLRRFSIQEPRTSIESKAEHERDLFEARQRERNEQSVRHFTQLSDAISPERRVVIAGAAQEAFWRVVAEMLPEAKTGDMAVTAVMEFSRACDRAVEIWARTNVRLPEGEHKAKLVKVAAYDCDNLIGEPKTTDYCKRCGQSPDSGNHISANGHPYEDPRV